MNIDKTIRGFSVTTFFDRYGHECSIQKSSLASEHCIWFGPNNANPQIMASMTPEGGTGWVPYPIPDNVSLYTRMHLTQENVRDLLPLLQHFAETGELPEQKQ